MATEYKIRVPAHPSIYDPKPRELDIFFCEPASGVNEDTGMLLFIAGFGAHAESKVYSKMRRIYADKYNLITIQCNYFGSEFMQESIPSSVNADLNALKKMLRQDEFDKICHEKAIDICILHRLCNKYDYKLFADANLSESLSNFNDMGVMQAIDNLTAVMVVYEILKDNNYTCNMGRVIAYGHSHGAYIAYLSNAFCPGFISLIIDNSAWLLPNYLYDNRYLPVTKDGLTYYVTFKYLARTLDMDMDIMDLRKLFKDDDGSCQIIAYQGIHDALVDYKEKKKFIDTFKRKYYIEVDLEDVDGRLFYSTEHGLGADFLVMFEHSMDNFDLIFDKYTVPKYAGKTISTLRAEYNISYKTGVPLIEVVYKNNKHQP